MKKTLSVLALLALSACGDIQTYPAQIEKQASAVAETAATPVDQIAISADSKIAGRTFTTVGPIKGTVAKVTAFHPAPTVEQGEQKLRVEAAELGADAVINAKIGAVEICPLSWGCRHVSGTAVKFTVTRHAILTP